VVCIEPAAIPIQRILAALALSRVGAVARDTARLTSQPIQVKIDTPADSVNVVLSNFSHEELILPKATVLGVAEEVSETLIDIINKEQPLNNVF
jgi:hypothetical protein